MVQTFLHIGYPKTGTTTLQEHLFPRHPDINYFGPRFTRVEGLFDVVVELSTKAKGRFDWVRAERAFGRFKEQLDPDKCNLFSSERGLEGGTTQTMNKEVVFSRYRKLLDNTRIIIVVRNQIDMLRSLSVYDRRKKELKISVEDWYQNVVSNRGSGWMQAFNYLDMFECLDEMFGWENVYVGYFEDLKRNQLEYANDICRYLEISQIGESFFDSGLPHENKRPSELYMKISGQPYRGKIRFIHKKNHPTESGRQT